MKKIIAHLCVVLFTAISWEGQSFAQDLEAAMKYKLQMEQHIVNDWPSMWFPEEVKSLLVGVIQNREQIKTYDIEVEIVNTRSTNSDVQGTQTKNTYRIYNSQPSLRQDHFYAVGAQFMDAYRETSCFGCPNNSAHLYFGHHPNNSSPDYHPGIFIRSRASVLDTKENYPGQDIYDLRYLALGPKSLAYSKDDFILYFSNGVEFADFEVHDDVIDNVPCKKVTRTTSSTNGKYRLEFWIAPNQGYSMRKILNESNDDILKRTVSFEIDVIQDKKSKTWYPKSWKREQKDEPKSDLCVVHDKELGIVKIHSINEGIDLVHFTINDIDIISPGTDVVWKLETSPPAEGSLIWDGNSIVSEGSYLLHSKGKTNRLRTLFVICVNITVLSGIVVAQLLRVYLRQQNSLKREKKHD